MLTGPAFFSVRSAAVRQGALFELSLLVFAPSMSAHKCPDECRRAQVYSSSPISSDKRSRTSARRWRIGSILSSVSPAVWTLFFQIGPIADSILIVVILGEPNYIVHFHDVRSRTSVYIEERLTSLMFRGLT
jgi:hypothetical protein